MSRKRTKRKLAPQIPNPMLHVMTSVAVIQGHALKSLRDKEAAALEAFRRGTPSRSDWITMSDVSNISETMGLGGIGPEVLSVCAKAEEVLAAGHERYRQYGTIGREDGEYEVLKDLCEYHDLQRISIPRIDYERAIRKTKNRIDSGHPSVKVCMG